MAKINPMLMLFILVGWVTFKSLIISGFDDGSGTTCFNDITKVNDCLIKISNEASCDLTDSPPCVELVFDALGNATEEIGDDCSQGFFGIADCTGAIVKLMFRFLQLVVGIIFSVIAIIINIVIVTSLIIVIGVTPIDGAPAAINALIITPFVLGVFVFAISFFTGD